MSGRTTHRLARSRIRVAALLAAIALLGAIVLVQFWRSGPASPQADQETAQADGQPQAAAGSVLLSSAQLHAQGVETSAIQKTDVIPVDGLPAQILAPLSASTQVVAPYGGIVTRVLADEGDPVEQGTALARIQSKEYLVAQADLERARADADAASRQARRDALLLAEGIIPAARNEQSQARATATQSTLRQAQGALARLRPAGNGQAGEYELLSPLSGRVMRRQLALGQAITASDLAFLIAEPGPMDVSFSVPLRFRSALNVGLQVLLPDGTMARITAIGGDVDPDSQSLRVRAHIDTGQAGSSRYAYGQQLSVTLLLPAPQDALRVPNSALLPAGSGQVLFALDTLQEGASGDARIHAVPVQLLGQDASHSTVRQVSPGNAQPGATYALTDEARVVTRGTALLKSMISLP